MTGERTAVFCGKIAENSAWERAILRSVSTLCPFDTAMAVDGESHLLPLIVPDGVKVWTLGKHKPKNVVLVCSLNAVMPEPWARRGYEIGAAMVEILRVKDEGLSRDQTQRRASQ